MLKNKKLSQNKITLNLWRVPSQKVFIPNCKYSACCSPKLTSSLTAAAGQVPSHLPAWPCSIVRAGTQYSQALGNGNTAGSESAKLDQLQVHELRTQVQASLILVH